MGAIGEGSNFKSGDELVTYLLVIGDTHIPDRASRVPEALLNVIESGRPWDVVVFTGDFTGEEVYGWVMSVGRKSYAVSGNMDYLPLPKRQLFSLNGTPAGVHHGNGIHPRGDSGGLTKLAISLGAKLLFSGHTHYPFIKRGLSDDVLLVNPGSLTGAWSGESDSANPSMIVAELRGNCYYFTVHELIGRRLSTRIVKASFDNSKWVVERLSSS